MRTLRSQKGDTIVEVLLAMAVVGIVLGLSYGTANRSLATGRAAQERSEALKIAESQIELLKSSYAASPLSFNNQQSFCMIDDGTGTISRETDIGRCTGVNGSSDFFEVSVLNTTHGGPVDTFMVQVNWDRVTGGANPEETLTLIYRPVQAGIL